MFKVPVCPKCGFKVPLKIRMFCNEFKGHQCVDCDWWLYRSQLVIHLKIVAIIVGLPAFTLDYQFNSIWHWVVCVASVIIGLYIQAYGPYPIAKEPKR